MVPLLMVVSAAMLTLPPMTTRSTATPTSMPISIHTPTNLLCSSSSFITTPTSPIELSTSKPTRTPITLSTRRRTPMLLSTPVGSVGAFTSTAIAARDVSTPMDISQVAPTSSVVTPTHTQTPMRRSPPAPIGVRSSMKILTPTLGKKTRQSKRRLAPTPAWRAPITLAQAPMHPAASALRRDAHTSTQPPNAHRTERKKTKQSQKTPTDAPYQLVDPPTLQPTHQTKKISTPTKKHLTPVRPRRRRRRHRPARTSGTSVATSLSTAHKRGRAGKNTWGIKERPQHHPENHLPTPAASSHESMSFSSSQSPPTSSLTTPMSAPPSSLSLNVMPVGIMATWDSPASFMKMNQSAAQTKLISREAHPKFREARKKKSAILSNFTLKSKSYRYGSRNLISSKAKTSELTLKLTNMKLSHSEKDSQNSSSVNRISRVETDDAKNRQRTLGVLDASDIIYNLVDHVASRSNRKKNVHKRNAEVRKEGEEELKHGDDRHGPGDERQDSTTDSTVVVSDTNDDGDENERGGDGKREKETGNKHKKRRRRRRGKGRGRRRGTRRRNDLSLWIDGRQVKMFSGYVMEIFAIHDGHVLPYILDPNFEKHLPVIPSEVENVNFTWQAGRKRYYYKFDRLYSQNEEILHAPVVSMATHGRVPKKPKVFTINIQCTGNASGVATFGIGLLIQSLKGKPLPGTPLRLQLRKECMQHGPDPECDQKCENGGVCDVDQRCLCPEGYMGQYCNTALCYPQCMNGGTCTTPGRCSCPPGFQGRHCEGGICRDKCENGGKCVQKDTCECPRGYYGNRCEFSKCVIPCVNGGKCRDVNKCRCPHGFAGDHCEIVLGQMDTAALSNSRCTRKCKYGSCSGSVCECDLGYSGRWCRRRSGKTVRRRIWL